MRHLDLFSGIGGFAYAVDQIWDNAEHVFCDFDKFCQQVLKRHWPESLIYGDIQSITNTERKGWWQRPITKERPITRPDNRPDLLTGGFPCQPFSAAGVRRGTADERYIWPEMLRVIQLTKPTWVIAENVRGLLTWNEGLVFEQVCLDLENEGYEVQPFIIPALAVNAPHRRDRIWWVAFNASGSPSSGTLSGVNGEANGVSPEDRPKRSRAGKSSRTVRLGKQRPTSGLQDSGGIQAGNRESSEDSLSQRSRGGSKSTRQILERQSPEVQDQRPDWSSHWLEVATALCSVDDGLPVELDGFKLTKSQSRKEQLKAYGNAIVPQVALEIMKGIKYAEELGERS